MFGLGFGLAFCSASGLLFWHRRHLDNDTKDKGVNDYSEVSLVGTVSVVTSVAYVVMFEASLTTFAMQVQLQQQ